MYRKSYFESSIIIFAWFLFPTTNGKLVPCNVSVESKVCFIVNDYVTTGIEKWLKNIFFSHIRNIFEIKSLKLLSSIFGIKIENDRPKTHSENFKIGEGRFRNESISF